MPSNASTDGMVHFKSYDSTLQALTAATGELIWKSKTGSERRFAATHLYGAEAVAETRPDPFDFYLFSPVVWGGAVYFGSTGGSVYALD
jgi:outer membrane protein assembly factor BamB